VLTFRRQPYEASKYEANSVSSRGAAITEKYSYHDLKRGWLNMLDVVKHQWNVFGK
jgi:hypothetical protein